MAILDESFYDPVPGYTQTRRRRTETPPPADVPRGGMPVPGSDPLAGVPERDIIPEAFADPLSPTRSQRYGAGDERDLGAPIVDPRSPSAPSPARWGSVTTRRVDPPNVPEPSELDRLLADENTRISWKGYASSPGEIRVPVDTGNGNVVSAHRVYTVGTADEIDAQIAAAKKRVADWDAAQRVPAVPRYVNEARTANGGYAYTVTDAPPPADQITPRPLFADAPGQSFADTLASGRRWQAEQDRLGLTTADMDYIRSYGRDAWNARQARYAPPTTRADYLARQGQNLAISVAERNAAQQELSRIDADQRRQDALAADAARMAAQLRMAEGANAATVEAARLTAQGQEAAAKAKAEAEAAAAAAAANAAAAKPVPMDAETPGMFVGGNWVENPSYNPKPVTGGGNSVATWDRENKTWKVEWPKNGNKPSQFSTLKPGETAYNQDTGEYFVAPGVDIASVQQEIANLTDALAKASSKTAPIVEQQLQDARERLAKLTQEAQPAPAPAPAPTASGGASSPSEPPAPTPAPGGRVPVQTGTARAPAAPADPWAAFGGLYTGK